MKPMREITAAEENFRAEAMDPQYPNIRFIKRDPVEPAPVGTIIAKLFRITGYAQDCDGSLMARIENINKDGEATGWEANSIGLCPDSTLALDSPRELHDLAEANEGPMGAQMEPDPACDDCGATGQALYDKSDHHGGTKRVCADRDACHIRRPG